MFFLKCQISEKWKKNRSKLQEKYQNGQLGNRWGNRQFKKGKATNGKNVEEGGKQETKMKSPKR